MTWSLYDAKIARLLANGQSRSAIQDWLDREGVTKRDRGQLNQKMDMLMMNGPDLPPKLLAGPLNSKARKLRNKHIYKLIIHGQIMLRPYLCKGPIDNEREFTMLMGCIERGGVNDRDPAEAEDVRESIIKDAGLRMPYERYH